VSRYVQSGKPDDYFIMWPYVNRTRLYFL
jgi:hypothetical protein